ncbi:carboxymuconolactone decarboxylase family protein [Streptomyces sp. NPDC002870]|uniref:carboxymuconolactone decarboxylase family protein n=1 Tax=Streptomyces sp. NPDC002870 TaxID=3364666 RepID=UPI0036ACC04F
MPRLPLIQPDGATGAAAELLNGVQKTLGATPNMMKAMANSPAALKAYLAFSEALAGGALRQADRERIALFVAQENACDYCLSAHTFLATKVAGLDESEAGKARRGDASDERAKAVLVFTASVLRGRGEVTDTDVDKAREAGMGEAEIAEIVAHIALNAFTNYFNKVAGTAVDWPLVRHDH